jgi:hypothetical protein
MKIAPKSIPSSEPSPPTTAPVRRRIESETGKAVGLAKPFAIANSAPATPAYAAAIAKASVL